MWFSTVASLGSNARVIAPDLPGFGKTPVRLGAKPSMEAMADYLAELLQQNDEKDAIVAGMSMGGYVALAFAEKYPDRTRGLGLISSQAAADTAEAKESRMEMIRKIRQGGPKVAIEAILPKLFSEARANRAELRDYPIAGASAAGVEGLGWALEAMAGRPDRTEFVQSLKKPVLVVHGSEDKIVPASRAHQLAESCKDPIWIELAGVGHASPLEAPDQVAAGLARLVQKCEHEAQRDSSISTAEKPPESAN